MAAMRQYSVTREELHSDLEARVKYLKTFLDFTNYDIMALHQGQKYIVALIPAVANIVYQKLLRYSITAQVFVDRELARKAEVDRAVAEAAEEGKTPPAPEPSTCPYASMAQGGKGRDEDPLSEDSPLIRRRKLFLRGYLRRLLSDPGRFEFWQYLDRVGMLHAGLDSKLPLNVEYIHLGLLLGVIQDVLTQAIIGHPRMQTERKAALISAIGKLIWIQNDLMARWHCADADDLISREGLIDAQRQKEALKLKAMEASYTTPIENDTGSVAGSVAGSADGSSVGDETTNGAGGGDCPERGKNNGREKGKEREGERELSPIRRRLSKV